MKQMHPNLDPQAASVACEAKLVTVREFKGTECYVAFGDWLDALIVQHQVQMLECAPDRMPAVRTRIKQIVALRDALSAETWSTGYIFD
jgi:hypothetical protein